MSTPYVDPEDPGDAPAPEVPGDAVPQQYSKAFMQFLKTVAASTGDLSALTCPSFLLSTTSLVEYSAYWADYPKLFAAIPKSTSEEGRMVAVLRWFVSTLSGSYYSRCSKGFEKKPYNPVLGEQFFCSFADVGSCGETKLACEQVCHHPPISAFYLENATAGVFLNGHCGQKSSFKGTSIKVEQTGRVILRTRDHSEIYIITYPDIHIRSLYTGSPFLELTGDCTIRATNGLVATLNFVPKPWFSGTYHQFTANITHIRDTSDMLYTASGKWMGKSTITNARTNATETLFDADASPMAERIVTPIEEQSPLESRKLWLKVTQAIESGNYSSATEEKKLIEEVQRAAKRERDSRGEAWAPRLFHFVKDEGSNDDVDGFLTGNESGRELSQKEKKKEKREARQREAAELAPGDGGSWVYNESLHLKVSK